MKMRHSGKDYVRDRRGVLMVILALTLVSAVPVLAEYDLSWRTIDGGGGISIGGDYVLAGTIGQADPGVMEGGDYVLSGGFWSGVNCIVNLTDLLIFCQYWLDSGDVLANLDETGNVDYIDFGILANYWLDFCPAGWKLKE